MFAYDGLAVAATAMVKLVTTINCGGRRRYYIQAEHTRGITVLDRVLVLTPPKRIIHLRHTRITLVNRITTAL